MHVMIKYITLLCLVLNMPFLSYSQCGITDVTDTLKNQFEVDAFDCSDFQGNLMISGTDIIALDSLSELTNIQGSLIIDDCPRLKYLGGLDNLKNIDFDLVVNNCDSLLTLNGLSGLDSVGSIILEDNQILRDIAAIESISQLRYKLRCYKNFDLGSLKLPYLVDGIQTLELDSNANLNSIEGLTLASVMDTIILHANPNLIGIESIDSVDSVSSILKITENASLSKCCPAFDLIFYLKVANGNIELSANADNCTTAGKISNFCFITERPCGVEGFEDSIFTGVELASFSCQDYLGSIYISTDEVELVAMSELQTISGSLKIENSNNLINLTGLNSVMTIGGALIIENNDSLVSLDGLGSLTNVEDLEIVNNTLIETIDGLDSIVVSRAVKIEDNANLSDVIALENIQFGETFNFNNNDKVVHLNALNSTSVIQSIEVQNNDGLRTLGTWSDLDSLTGSLMVKNNPLLNECCALFDLLDGVKVDSDSIFIQNNFSSCSSISSIETACFKSERPCGIENYTDTFSLSTDIDAFDCSHYEGSLYIKDSIPSLVGLNGLQVIDGSLILDGLDLLLSLDGLNSLDTVKGDLILNNISKLDNIDALGALKYIGGELVISGLDSIENLDGLDSASGYSILKITNNTSLKTLSDLKLSPQMELVQILNNGKLTQIYSFELIDTIMDTFQIVANSSLSECCVNYEIIQNSSAAYIEIASNSDRCNSINEIDNVCRLNVYPCGQEGVVDTFDYQVDISNLNCMEYLGGIYLRGDEIEDLVGFENLTVINGDLTFDDLNIDFFGALSKLDSVYGNLEIKNLSRMKSITNLSGLLHVEDTLKIHNMDSLTSVEGFDSLYIQNIEVVGVSQLQSIDGLVIPDTVNYVSIRNNDTLSNIWSFSTLSSVTGDFEVSNNPSLEQCCYLFKYIDDTSIVKGELIIENNAGECLNDSMINDVCLAKLCGIVGVTDTFEMIDEVRMFECSHYLGSIYVTGSDISDLTGMSELTEIDGSLIFKSASSIEYFDGLANLEIIGEDFILSKMDNAISLNGLSSLNEVNGRVKLKGISNLRDVDFIEQLSDINDLEISNSDSITTLGNLDFASAVDSILIIGNRGLTDISAIASIEQVNSKIELSSNIQLRTCCPLIYLIDTVGIDESKVIVYDNDDYCETIDTARFYCQYMDSIITSIDDLESKVLVYPNPADNIISIDGLEGTNRVRIVSVLGQVVFYEEAYSNHQNSFIGDLKSGIYSMEIQSGNKVHKVRLLIN